jgi:carboxypeptidase Taq
MTAYSDLMAFQRDTQALAEISGRLGWDQETIMPRGAAAQRGDELGAIEGVLHERRVDARVGDWLTAIDASELDQVGQAQIREIRRSFERNSKVSARLASEIARVSSQAQGEWAEARANEDFAAFVPTLEKVVALRREEGQALAEGGEESSDAYDALLADYEPGTSSREIAALFDALRPGLVELRDKIMGSSVTVAPLEGRFDTCRQMKLTQELALTFGYDLNRGRIDKAVHPFCSGSGADVRITTRTALEDPFNCFYSTIHEVGHGCYEQAVDPSYALTPIGRGASMGVHESQSRIFENQLARSRAFTGYLYERMSAEFGTLSVAGPDEFHAAVNRVYPGYIRTEADEVQYNLHIMMRFDLERQLMEGSLSVADLPEAWNTRFLADFGVAVDKPSNGCLQDVHWPVGLMGYFPTYTLGNVYAGCLEAAMRKDLPDLDADLARGDLSAATGWLRERVQVHGGLFEPRDTIRRACGFEPSEKPLLAYLNRKFGDIYGF